MGGSTCLVASLKRGSDTPRLIGYVAIYSSMSDRSTSTSNRLAVDQPTRSADCNRSLVNHVDPATDETLLPALEDGITLLDVDGDRGVPVLQSLVLDHILLHDGPAFWVDANGHATPATLTQIAPSQRFLARIQVARGFTASQHYGAVCDLPTAVNQSIRNLTTDTGTRDRQSPGRDKDTSPHTPAPIIAPAVDAQYRADDTLRNTHAKSLQIRTLARLAIYADGCEIPVLVTQNERNERNEFTEPVATVADHHFECEQTRMGPRVVGENFEAPFYPVDDGAYYQTTFAYWRQVLAARANQVGVEPTTSAPSTPAPKGVGTGVTADGETVAATIDPLLGARTATGPGGR